MSDQDAIGSEGPRGPASDLGPFADAPEELYAFAADGRVLAANGAACRALRASEEALCSLYAWDILVRQTPTSFAKLAEAVRREGSQLLFGHQRRADGSSYAVEARLWSARLAGAECLLALVRDAHVVRSLIEERDQLISLVENSSEVILVATPDGLVAYVNAAGIAMLGLERIEDVLGRPMLTLFPEHEHEILTTRVLPQIAGGRWAGELRFKHQKSGALTPVWMNAFSIRMTRGEQVAGLAAVAHDITERKATERQRERILRLNEVGQQVATSLLEQDDLNRAISFILEGVGRVLNVTSSFLFRYREDRAWVFRTHQWTAGVEGMRRVEPRPEQAQSFSWATEVLARGDAIRMTDLGATEHGNAEVFALLGADARALLVLPVVIHGRMESFIGFVDASGPREWGEEEFAIVQIIVDSFARAVERRIAERERAMIARDLEKAVAREKAANRYKSEFLANMSHELRTPMNAIVGYAELLSRPNVDRHKQESWLANIRRSTDHLLSLINDVLDLSKIEAGQMTIELEHCRLADLVNDVVTLLRGSAEEKLLEFRTSFDSPIPEAIRIDPVRFKQILINLVGNAIKFTHRGGVVVRVESSGDSAGASLLRVSVVDTGIGIAADALKDLFMPFSQVHERRSSRFGGTGLGLDISRHLARLLGGDIEVRSEVGLGSTFTLRLPVMAVELEGSGGAPLSDPAAREANASDFLVASRILVVDDSPDNREVLCFLLEEAGARCEAAEHGARGVELALSARAAGAPHDIILMDMNMPVMDGYEATALLRERGLATPILALTAMATTGDRERCRVSGCTDYVMKPVVPRLFLETVAKYLKTQAPAEVVQGESHPASLLDNPRFAPLVKRYVESLTEQARLLEEAFASGRLEEVRMLVHRLRGTAANYGHPELSREAGSLEDAIRGGRAQGELEHGLGIVLERLRRIGRIPRAPAREREPNS